MRLDMKFMREIKISTYCMLAPTYPVSVSGLYHLHDVGIPYEENLNKIISIHFHMFVHSK